jgi:hypothetical protein
VTSSRAESNRIGSARGDRAGFAIGGAEGKKIKNIVLYDK